MGMQVRAENNACITSMKNAAKFDRSPAMKNTPAMKYGYTGGIQAVGPLATANGELKPWCAVMEVAIFTISSPDFHKSSVAEIGQCCTISKATRRTNIATRQMNSSNLDSVGDPNRLRCCSFLAATWRSSSTDVREPSVSIMRNRMGRTFQNYCGLRSIVRRRIAKWLIYWT